MLGFWSHFVTLSITKLYLSPQKSLQDKDLWNMDDKWKKGTTTIRTNDISYNSQKPDISYTDNWYKNETGHFVQKTIRQN